MKEKLLSAYRFLRYLMLRYAKERMFCNVWVDERYELHAVSDHGISFFGYYGISPENDKGDVLYLTVGNESVRGSLNEPAKIMVKSKDGADRLIAETMAWNWQQGCMLQWLGQSDRKIIFNSYNKTGDRYLSYVVDIENNEARKYDKPIYCLAKDGSYALTLSFERLALMRPDYGYFHRAFDKESLLPYDKDGIWRIDIETGNTKLIVSLEELIQYKYVDTMSGAMHKVNHIEISPSGDRFMFLHRWIGPAGRFMRLITADKGGGNLCVLNGDIMTSHSCWLDKNRILSYCEYNGKCGYFVFIDNSSVVKEYSPLMPKEDGHPSILGDDDQIICDTYPRKSRISKLIFVDRVNEIKTTLFKGFQYQKFAREMRIDLHPKVGCSGKKIFFESGHEGKRKLYYIEVAE